VAVEEMVAVSTATERAMVMKKAAVTATTKMPTPTMMHQQQWQGWHVRDVLCSKRLTIVLAFPLPLPPPLLLCQSVGSNCNNEDDIGGGSNGGNIGFVGGYVPLFFDQAFM
jgi:hypothetical protein